MTAHVFTDAGALDRFMRAGRAIFTVESTKTGRHFTYRVLRPAADPGAPMPPLFVNLLVGPDNTANYTYAGVLGVDRVRLTRGSKLTAESVGFKAINYVLKHVAAGQLPPDAAVRHEGRCGRCGLRLTVPSSIDAGIGPECAQKGNRT